jgi:uncharacterized repeat protein (TIGR03803 family)
MLWEKKFVSFASVAGVGLALAFLANAGAASAATYKVVYSFCSRKSGNGICHDGRSPNGGVVADSLGNLFGATLDGGNYKKTFKDTGDKGTIFELSPGDSGQWNYQQIYSFCRKKNCADGYKPFGPLVLDVNGNIYGTTQSYYYYPKKCKKTDCGVAFELSHAGGKWKFSILYVFSKADGGGVYPSSLTYSGARNGQLYDGNSPLYGTTYSGGANDGGTVFSLTPNGTKWTHSVVHDFCSKGCTSDGYNPKAGMIADSSGKLIGTTARGGSYDQGTIFELSSQGQSWAETIRYSYCDGIDCPGGSDGYSPRALLAEDNSGDLYGPALGGYSTNGVEFSLDANGHYAAIWQSCQMGQNCLDGWAYSALTIEPYGLLGAANHGGLNNYGAMFTLTYDQINQVWDQTILYNFCSQTDCADGSYPDYGSILNLNSRYYGEATTGGANGEGVVYELTP